MGYQIIDKAPHLQFGELYVVRFEDIDYIPTPRFGISGERVIARNIDISALPPGQWIIYGSFRNCEQLRLVLCKRNDDGTHTLYN
jgi:hypothetical protein